MTPVTRQSQNFTLFLCHREFGTSSSRQPATNYTHSVYLKTLSARPNRLSECRLLAHSGGSRRRNRMSAMQGKPDGRRMRPEPALLIWWTAPASGIEVCHSVIVADESHEGSRPHANYHDRVGYRQERVPGS